MNGAVSGVGKLFERAGASLLGNPPSDAEDGRLEKLIGFSSTKRDYAAEFGVDPYSSNPVLQVRLDEMAWAGYAGKITASAALSLVSGGALDAKKQAVSNQRDPKFRFTHVGLSFPSFALVTPSMIALIPCACRDTRSGGW